VSPMRYHLGFYIPADGILHSRCRENLRSYQVVLFDVPGGLSAQEARRNVTV
jgi:hypothetical protein